MPINIIYLISSGEPGTATLVGDVAGLKGDRGDVGPVGPPGKTNTIYCKETNRNVSYSSVCSTML
jgi:hypothetical protein